MSFILLNSISRSNVIDPLKSILLKSISAVIDEWKSFALFGVCWKHRCLVCFVQTLFSFFCKMRFIFSSTFSKFFGRPPFYECHDERPMIAAHPIRLESVFCFYPFRIQRNQYGSFFQQFASSFVSHLNSPIPSYSVY